jgi:hypothetical protein
MLCLGSEHEARVVRERRVHHVVVVVDPRSQPGTEAIDERLGRILEARPADARGERHIEHHDPTR